MRVIYLIQGDLEYPVYDLPEGSDWLYLQWKPDFKPMENSFHFPNSTWGAGRNELYRRARIKGEYDYYIFLDDDITMEAGPKWRRAARGVLDMALRGRPFAALRLGLAYLEARRSQPDFTTFEGLLEKHGSLIATPRDWEFIYNRDGKLSEVDAITFGEQNFIAIHHSIADEVLPYDIASDQRNWWLGSRKFYEHASALFGARVHRFSRIQMWNQGRREYPRGALSAGHVANKIGEAISQPMRPRPQIDPQAPALTAETAVVITSIAGSTPQMQAIGARAERSAFRFIVVGDAKSPPEFTVPGAEFVSLADQREMPFRLASLLPVGHYARKNLGYLAALQDPRITTIVETDDDNAPLTGFWDDRQREREVDLFSGRGWVNAYHHFTRRQVWPRGFPLERINDLTGALHLSGRRRDTDGPEIREERRPCLLQQGLVQHDPDIDAIFRLAHRLPIWFQPRGPIQLGPGLWCPFNSQNTTWAAEIAALMYLPSHCPMRETDIWRGILAQRVLWTFGEGVTFHEATMLQVRNEHDLMRDFDEETRLYTEMTRVTGALAALELEPGAAAMPANLRRCYAEMTRLGIFPEEETPLLDAWLADIAEVEGRRAAAKGA